MPLRVLFLDLNSYFASVEQAENPSLMGKPIAVVPMMADTTCCLAASYPAKARGIKTGTRVGDARKLCPNITFVKANHRRYVEYHHRIKSVVEKCFPIWKVFSIDEMAIRLYGREQNTDFAIAKAKEIKQRIMNEVHPALTCSVGIAPNRYLAKIASDMQKPDGLTIIQSEELPTRLFNLNLRDFPGIGPRMEERLIAARCFNARILCEKSSPEMEKLWGSKVGIEFWNAVRGVDADEREIESPRKSISHSRVLAPDSRTPEQAWANLVGLLSKAAMRLREERVYARTLHLYLKYLSKFHGTSYWDCGVRVFETQDSNLLLNELHKIWISAPKGNIFKVGVVLGGLVSSEHHQLSLFEDPKQTQLMSALDTLNKSNRKNLVVFGESTELKSPAHAPIAFSHIPESFE